MTPNGIREWWRHHCSLVCIHHEDYDLAFEEALPIFLRMRSTVQELDDASIWLWSEPDRLEKKWGVHLSMIRKEILCQRRKAEASKKRKVEDWDKTPLPPLKSVIGSIGKSVEESA
jgi:hypothetical protein